MVQHFPKVKQIKHAHPFPATFGPCTSASCISAKVALAPTAESPQRSPSGAIQFEVPAVEKKWAEWTHTLKMISIATHSKPWLQHPPFLGTKCILPVQIYTDGVSCIFGRSEWKAEASVSHFHSRRNHRMGHKCHQGHHQAQTGCFLPWGGTFSLAQCHP